MDVDDERWMLLDGRRWRRTDPALPDDLVTALKSHLGRGRAAVRIARGDADAGALAAARERVDLAKHGLGERGPYWWERAEDERIRTARRILHRLDARDAGVR